MSKIYQKIVKNIDKELKFVERYVGGFHPYFVFKVVDEKCLPFILKSSPYAQKENTLLEELKDVQGISRVKKYYGLVQQSYRHTYYAILKEYVEGNSLEEDEIVQDPFLQMQIAEFVRACHQRRIAYLELVPRNIIISPDRKTLTVIDIDSADFFDREEEKSFKIGKKQDIQDLEELFGWR